MNGESIERAQREDGEHRQPRLRSPRTRRARRDREGAEDRMPVHPPQPLLDLTPEMPVGARSRGLLLDANAADQHGGPRSS